MKAKLAMLVSVFRRFSPAAAIQQLLSATTPSKDVPKLYHRLVLQVVRRLVQSSYRAAAVTAPWYQELLSVYGRETARSTEVEIFGADAAWI